MDIADVTGKIPRWRLRLSKYEFDVVQQPGVKHQVAVAVLRLKTDSLVQSPVDDDITFL